MRQEAIIETLPSWIGFLGGPCLQPVLNGRLACQQMLSLGISVSLSVYKSPFARDKRGWNRGRAKAGVAKQGRGGTCVLRYMLWSQKVIPWVDCQFVSGWLSMSAQRCVLQGRHQKLCSSGYSKIVTVAKRRNSLEIIFYTNRTHKYACGEGI